MYQGGPKGTLCSVYMGMLPSEEVRMQVWAQATSNFHHRCLKLVRTGSRVRERTKWTRERDPGRTRISLRQIMIHTSVDRS